VDKGEHRPEPPKAGPPVEMVEAFLDFQRATLLWKLDGVSDEELRRPRTSSGMSLLGMLKHSAYVERGWFQIAFAGRDEEPGYSADDPDADWRIEPHETTAAIVALYHAECEKSRQIVALAAWDDVAKGERGRGFTLGWILTHMVEEVARHNGHADIFRELIDGKTGE